MASISSHKSLLFHCKTLIFTILVFLCPPSPIKKYQKNGHQHSVTSLLLLVEGSLAGILEMEQPVVRLRGGKEVQEKRKIIVTFADRMATQMPDWTGWDKELRRRWGQQLAQGQITRDQHLAKELQLHGAHYVKGAEGDNSKIQTVWAGPRGDRPIDIAFTGSYSVINKFAERIRQGVIKGEKHTMRSAAKLLDQAYRESAALTGGGTRLKPAEYLMTDYRNIYKAKVGLPKYKRINDIGRRGLADRERRRRRRRRKIKNTDNRTTTMIGKRKRTPPTSAEHVMHVLRTKNGRGMIRKRPRLPAPSGFRLVRPGGHLHLAGYYPELADPELVNTYGQREMAVKEDGSEVVADLSRAFSHHARLGTHAGQRENSVSGTWEGRAVNRNGKYIRFGREDEEEIARLPKREFPTNRNQVLSRLVDNGELLWDPRRNKFSLPRQQPIGPVMNPTVGVNRQYGPMEVDQLAESVEPMEVVSMQQQIGGSRSRQGRGRRRSNSPSGTRPSTSASSSATASSPSTARNPQPPPVPTSSSSSSSRRRSRSRGKSRSGSRDRRKRGGIGKNSRQNG